MEPADFLRDVQTIGENRDFLRQALVIERDTVGELANGRAQAIPLLDEPRRSSLVDAMNRMLDHSQPCFEILSETCALGRSHVIERRDRTVDDRHQLGRSAFAFIIG
jgi:hypothetical protein